MLYAVWPNGPYAVRPTGVIALLMRRDRRKELAAGLPIGRTRSNFIVAD